MALFPTKYLPQHSRQVFGQENAIAALRDFILTYRTQGKKGALLHGPIGNGKTSSVYALAKELGYELLEINSSDFRDESSIKTMVGAAVSQQSLFFTPKIVLVDEIDNISGREDRGAVPALLKVMAASRFPLLFTANDITDSRLKPLVKACRLIEFPALPYKTVEHALRWVAEQEGIVAEDRAISSLARQADGDVRAALIDLQVCAASGACRQEDVQRLSARKRTDLIMDALTRIFKSSTAENALGALEQVDMELHDVLIWLDENLPREYLDARSLAKAYEHLARADVFQGRIRRQQHWRFLVYINNLLTAGISSAKERRNANPVQYQRTMRFLKMWQAKMKWAKRKEIAEKVALATHTSRKVAYQQMPHIEVLFRKASPVQRDALVQELHLEEEEVEWMGR